MNHSREGVIRRLIRRIRKTYPEGPTIYSDNDLARLRTLKTTVDRLWKNYEKSRKIIRLEEHRRKMSDEI